MLSRDNICLSRGEWVNACDALSCNLYDSGENTKRGPIALERNLCFVKNTPHHKAMIYFVFAFAGWLKGAFDMIKGTVHKAWFPGMGRR